MMASIMLRQYCHQNENYYFFISQSLGILQHMNPSKVVVKKKPDNLLNLIIGFDEYDDQFASYQIANRFNANATTLLDDSGDMVTFNSIIILEHCLFALKQ